MRVPAGLVVLLVAACTMQPAGRVGEVLPDLPRHELLLAQHSDAARTDYDIWRMCGDGNWLAFSAGVSNDGVGTFDLWLMRPDGSARRVLNKAANTQAWHKWRPGNHYCR